MGFSEALALVVREFDLMHRRPISLFAVLTAVCVVLMASGCGSQQKPPADGKASDTARPRAAVASKTASKGPEPKAAGPAAPSTTPMPAKARSAMRATTGSAPGGIKETLPTNDAGRAAGEVAPSIAPRMAPTEPSSTGAVDEEISPSPWKDPISAKTKEYTVLNVFYGTDRKLVPVSDARVDAYDDWFYVTAICAAATICLALASLKFSRGRAITVAACSGLAITVLLGVATTMERLRSEEINPGSHIGYSNDRGEVQLGQCQVSIPKYHEVGTVERPSILRLDFREDPRKHVVLLDVQQEPPEEFFASLKAKVQASQQQSAFVFVHGYNVTFEDAARRTAQLAYDLKFDGAPIFFSWPSQGGLLQYAVDETNVAWTVPHLKEFLVSVARQSGAQSIHLIAHSMGNRALTSALLSLAPRMKKESPMFHEVVLTAPDIDADVFKRDIAPRITRAARRVTLYASSNDEALALSKRLHGYPRAGESGADLVVVDGVDTVDVSNVDTSLVGHSYYGSNDTVLADLFYVLTEPKPAQTRSWLAPVPLGSMIYWVFNRESARLRAASGPEKAVR